MMYVFVIFAVFSDGQIKTPPVYPLFTSQEECEAVREVVSEETQKNFGPKVQIRSLCQPVVLADAKGA